MPFYLEHVMYEGYYKTDRKGSYYLVQVIINLANLKCCHHTHTFFFVHTMRGPNVLLEATTFH